MPSINHKRKSKTSKKSSKSSKHSKNVKRNKKTRSNIRKMRGGSPSKIIGRYKNIDFNDLNMTTNYYIVKNNIYIDIGKYISNGFKDKVFFSNLSESIDMNNIIVFTKVS